MAKKESTAKEIQDYDELYKNFKWEVPKYYNFGFDVVDIVVPKKGGARFTRDGKTMIGFLEP